MRILSLISFILFSSFLHADCSSPTGVEGQLSWISGESKIKFCDGSNWVDTTGSTEGSCVGTTAGTVNYVSGSFQYCNGANWISMKGASLGACTGHPAGEMTYDTSSNKMKFCDGSTWYSTEGGGCPLPWGGSLAEGGSVTSYYSNTGTCAHKCANSSVVRTCTGGVLSFGYDYASCSDATACSVVGIEVGVGVYAGSNSATFTFRRGSTVTPTSRANMPCSTSCQSCGGSGNTQTVSCSGGTTKGSNRQYFFSQLPTSATVSMSGNGTVGYKPTFHWVYNDGSVGGSALSSCTGDSHYYTSWNTSLTCTFNAPP